VPIDVSAPWKGNTQQALDELTVGVFMDPASAEFPMGAVKDTDVSKEQWIVYIPAKDLTRRPVRGDWLIDMRNTSYSSVTIADNGTKYQVASVMPIEPGLTPYCHVLQVER
jgi:hypothetical protein